MVLVEIRLLHKHLEVPQLIFSYLRKEPHLGGSTMFAVRYLDKKSIPTNLDPKSMYLLALYGPWASILPTFAV